MLAFYIASSHFVETIGWSLSAKTRIKGFGEKVKEETADVAPQPSVSPPS